MKSFEQKLLDEIYLKREEQWKHCIDYLEKFAGVKKDCIIYNTEYCPMRCREAMKRIKIKPLYINENIKK